MRADASRPATVTGLAWQAPRRSLHRGDANGAALASTENTVRRLRAELRDKARRALSPPGLVSRCGVNCFAIQHNGLLHAVPPVARQARFVSAPRATPVMSCAPQHLQRLRLRLVRPGVPGRRSRSQAPQAARSWGRPRPATHPPPRGSPAPSTVLAQRSAVLAASRPEPFGRASAALTRLRLGAP